MRRSRQVGSLVFFSMSKRSARTCWRVGWVAGDAKLVAMFRKVKTNVDLGISTFTQDAAVAALEDEAYVEAFRAAYREKRDVMLAAFQAVGLEDCTPPASLYSWQKVPEGMSGVDFAARLHEPEIAVVCTPGEWISDPTADGSNPAARYARFALVPTLEDTKLAAKRIAKLTL